MTKSESNPLGDYLRDRRGRLDPVSYGFSPLRRRTPGLRREEVAQRANVSATWYTWLEQGRGGQPSTDVLDRLSAALSLSEVEREHLFLLAQNRPPAPRYEATAAISPALRQVLDGLPYSPAYVKTAAWDILGWNRAAALVLTDYGRLPEGERNLLRLLFGHRLAGKMPDWQSQARFVVASFRAEVARAGATAQVSALVEELSRTSADFAAIWREHDLGSYGGGSKRLHHPVAGLLTLHYSTFAVDGRPDLSLVIFSPATAEDVARIKSLVEMPVEAQAAE